MPFHEPFMLGPFSVDAEGRLALAHPERVPGFSVKWRERVVHARLSQSTSNDGVLHIHSVLGRIPSTVSDPSTRLACLSLFRALTPALPDTWRVRLLPDHRSRLETETPITMPVTVTTLVTVMTAFLIGLTPYLDLLDEAGVTTPEEAHPA